MSSARVRELLAAALGMGAPFSTEAFARLVFPRARAWRDEPRRGRKHGGSLIRATGGVLGRLRARGLVERTSDDQAWLVTAQGREFLLVLDPAQALAPAAPVRHPNTQQQVLAPSFVQPRTWVDQTGRWWATDGAHVWVWSGAAWVLWRPPPQQVQHSPWPAR